jgi:DNA-binding PadR family transcriptional regulator
MVGEGSIYPLLGRFEHDGLVETRRAGSNGGPPRNYYVLSPEGERVLEAGVKEWQAARDAVDGSGQSGGIAMNEFVEECRRECQHLGVPDPVANEMAADLTIDMPREPTRPR